HARYLVRRYARWIIGTLVLLAVLLAIWVTPRGEPPAPPAPPVDVASNVPVAAGAEQLDPLFAQPPETELHAVTQLLSRWQVGSEEASVREATRCPSTFGSGLNCLRGRASLEQIVRFDRPLILLLDKNEVRLHALLLGAGRERVRLDVAGQTIELPRTALSEVWNGDFVAVWRVPVNISMNLKRGDAGPAVAWAKDRLNRLDNAADGESGPAFFDEALEERVRKLQLAYGIKADGIIGPETLFALSALGESGPHLTRTID
ncbi:MAG: peptidoglycan-binding domain-containing protein, partial [Dokdonella sp.]